MGKKKLQKEKIVVAGLDVEVWRKPIKNINLAVYGLDGRVRISVPGIMTDARVRQVVRDRMGWIRKQLAFRPKLPEPVALRAVDGELHDFFGKSYPLNVFAKNRRYHVQFDPAYGISLHVRSGTSTNNRLRLLAAWYREEMEKRIRLLLSIWQPRVGEKVNEFRIKKMKTRWGTCNITARRLWLNLELAKKPEECLEYILVHELVHLLERGHNRKFYAHMDRLLPQWRNVERLLK